MNATVHVKHLSGYLTGLYQIENRVDKVSYLRNFPHGLPGLNRILGSVLVQWRIPDAGGYGVEADPRLCILDGETPGY